MPAARILAQFVADDSQLQATARRAQATILQFARESNQALDRSSQQSTQSINRLSGGVTALTGSLGALGISIGASGLLQLGGDALGTANSLEKTEATVRVLSGSTGRYGEVLALARANQERFGGSLEQNIQSLGSFVNTANRSGVALESLDNIARRLDFSDPVSDINDATVALREFISGDITSLAERFEIPRSALRNLAQEGVSTQQRLEGLDKLMNDMGVTNEVLAAATDTNAAAFDRLGSAASNARDKVGGFISDALAPAARGLTFLLGAFDNTEEGIRRYIAGWGQALGLSDEAVATLTALSLAGQRQVGILDETTTATNGLATAQQQLLAAGDPLERQIASQSRALEYWGGVLDKQRLGISALQLEIDKAEAGLRPFEERLNTAQDAVDAQARKIELAERALQPFRDRVDEASAAVDNQNALIRQATHDLGPWIERLDEAQQAVDDQARKIELAERALQPLRDRVAEANAAVEEQRDVIREATDALGPWEAALESAQQDVENQRDAIQDAIDALQPFRDRIAEAEQAVSDQREAIARAEAALRPYEDALRDAERAVRDQEKAIKDAEAALKPYQDAVREAEERVRDQERAIADAERALQPYADAVERAERAVAEQERAIEAAERALRPYEDAVRDAERAVADQERAIADAEKALRPYERAVADARATLDKTSEGVADARERFDGLKEGIDNAREAMEEWRRAPLVGTRAFNDQIAGIDKQILALELQMTRLEGVRGTGRQRGQIARQLAQLQRQRREAEQAFELDTFDARRAIENFGQDQQEFTPEQILAGMADAQRTVESLTPELDAAEQAWRDQVAAQDAAAEALERAEEALQGQKDAIEPLREQLELYREQLDSAKGALERQQEAIQPLRDALDGLKENVRLAREEYERQDAAIDPLREALAGYKIDLDNARTALEEQDRAIDPLREKLGLLQGNVDLAREALEKQRDAIQPLKDRLGELETSLGTARKALDDATKLSVEPLRKELKNLEDKADDARKALDKKRDAIKPLQDKLTELEGSLRSEQKALDAARTESVKPLEDAMVFLKDDVYEAKKALDAQRDTIKPLQDKLWDLEESLRSEQKALNAARTESVKPLEDAMVFLKDDVYEANKALDAQRNLSIEPLRLKLEELQLELGTTQLVYDTEKTKLGELKKPVDDLTTSYNNLAGAIRGVGSAYGGQPTGGAPPTPSRGGGSGDSSDFGGSVGTIWDRNPLNDPRPSQAGINTVVQGGSMGPNTTFDADRGEEMGWPNGPGQYAAHEGLDLQVRDGTPVKLPYRMRVHKVGKDQFGPGHTFQGYDDLGRRWLFAHMMSLTRQFKTGEWLAKGTVIGYVGSGHVHVQLSSAQGPNIDPSAALNLAAQPAPGPQGTGSAYTGQSASPMTMWGTNAGAQFTTGLVVGMETQLPALEEAIERIFEQIGWGELGKETGQDLAGGWREGIEIEMPNLVEGIGDGWRENIDVAMPNIVEVGREHGRTYSEAMLAYLDEHLWPRLGIIGSGGPGPATNGDPNAPGGITPPTTPSTSPRAPMTVNNYNLTVMNSNARQEHLESRFNQMRVASIAR